MNMFIHASMQVIDERSLDLQLTIYNTKTITLAN